MQKFTRLLRDEAGATAIEYALIVSLISLGALAAIQGIGDQLETSFNNTSSAMAGGSSSGGNTGAGTSG